MRAPLPPIVLETVLDDATLVVRLARANAPYFPVQRYFSNTAVVGDNDVMFHRVESIGGPDDEMARGLSLDSALRPCGSHDWEVVDGDRVLGAYRDRQLRISVSWKAQVFADEDAARTHDQHTDDLDLPRVLEIFRADFAARGEALPVPAEPLHDRDFVGALSRAYAVGPTVYPWGPAS